MEEADLAEQEPAQTEGIERHLQAMEAGWGIIQRCHPGTRK